MSKLDRKEIRFEVIWKAKLRTDQGATYHACIHNASASGLRIINEQPLIEGSTLEIQLLCRLSRRMSVFTLSGTVVYCTYSESNIGYKIGVNLTRDCESYQNQINQMLEDGYPVYD